MNMNYFAKELNRKAAEKCNPLLCAGGFPREYEGYKIVTDFRVGILLTLLFDDEEVSAEDKTKRALLLLFGSESNIPSDINLAWNAVVWFLSLGYNKSVNSISSSGSEDDSKDSEEFGIKDENGNIINLGDEMSNDGVSNEVFDFEFDSSRIYSGFLRTSGIDLTEIEYMHFFKFMFLLADLDSDTSYSKVVDIRQTSLADKKGKELSAWLKMKKVYEIPCKYSKESLEKLQGAGIDDNDLQQFMQF